MLGIRHTEIRDSESGFGKSDKLWCGLPHFAWDARKHWPGWRPSISSWCGRFPLDEEGHGAVGWAYERHGYHEFPDGVCVVDGVAGSCEGAWFP
jgi:hypothetical protein